MAITDRIETSPTVMLGKPVIRGTRITVEFDLRKLSEGASEADLLDAYPRLRAGSSRRRSATPQIRWLTRRRWSWTRQRAQPQAPKR